MNCLWKAVHRGNFIAKIATFFFLKQINLTDQLGQKLGRFIHKSIGYQPKKTTSYNTSVNFSNKINKFLVS